MLYSSFSHAYYFAYIPDQANDSLTKYLHVINTSLDLYVDKILISGTPRDVALNHRGDYVFVSAIITEGSRTVSKINVVSTQENINTIALTIPYSFVKGLTLSSDDSVLYVTHDYGVTRIIQPTFSYVQKEIKLTYRGASVVLSEDDKYLFVIGTDENNIDGISVVDVSQDPMKEVITHELGAGLGANTIAFDNTSYQLFVVTASNHPTDKTIGGQLIKLDVNNYDFGSPSLTQLESKAFALNSFPLDVALDPKKSDIYVTLSYTDRVNPDTGYGEGFVSILDRTNLSATSQNLSLSTEKGVYPPPNGDGAVHPLAIGFDDNGKLHAVKQLWNEYSGTYVSGFYYYTSPQTGTQTLIEKVGINLGNKSSSQLTGKFIGANCTNCPSGLEGVSQPQQSRPSSINPFMILFTLFFLVPLRLFTKRYANKINYS